MFLFRDTILSEKTEIRSALKKIYSLSWYKSNLILTIMGINYTSWLKNLNYYNINFLIYLLKNFNISETKIKRAIELNINQLIHINSYKGIRHKLCLPVRGQRTRTNAGTQRRKRLKG